MPFGAAGSSLSGMIMCVHSAVLKKRFWQHQKIALQVLLFKNVKYHLGWISQIWTLKDNVCEGIRKELLAVCHRSSFHVRWNKYLHEREILLRSLNLYFHLLHPGYRLEKYWNYISYSALLWTSQVRKFPCWIRCLWMVQVIPTKYILSSCVWIVMPYGHNFVSILQNGLSSSLVKSIFQV